MKFLRMAKAVNELDYYIYKMRNTLKKKDINIKLTSIEIEKIESSIAVATNLADESNHQVEIDVLEDHLKRLESSMEYIIAKTVQFFLIKILSIVLLFRKQYLIVK